jgi:excinuclease UvrABC nuclease subunit
MATPTPKSNRSPAFRWHLIDPTSYQQLPDLPGCYVIVVAGQPFYIGQSMSIRARFTTYRIRHSWGSHRERMTPWGCFEDVVVKVKFGRRYGDWLMREARLIRRLQPVMNCVGSVRPRQRRNIAEVQ